MTSSSRFRHKHDGISQEDPNRQSAQSSGVKCPVIWQSVTHRHHTHDRRDPGMRNRLGGREPLTTRYISHRVSGPQETLTAGMEALLPLIVVAEVMRFVKRSLARGLKPSLGR